MQDVIIALQKSFSRANQMTAENQRNNGNNPTSRIVGDVEFSISTKAVPGDGDELLIDKDGHVGITFNGTIDLDMDDEPNLDNQELMAN